MPAPAEQGGCEEVLRLRRVAIFEADERGMGEEGSAGRGMLVCRWRGSLFAGHGGSRGGVGGSTEYFYVVLRGGGLHRQNYPRRVLPD